MKNKIKTIGIIAIAVLFGFGMSACDMLGEEMSLAIPDNVRVEADASGFFLKWDAVIGAPSYLVDINGETFPSSATSFSLQSLTTEHKVHQLKVKAVAPGGQQIITDSAFSAVVDCEPATYIFTSVANSPLRITGLTDYGETLETIVIPEQIGSATVTAIGNGAFENNTTMTSVVIPETVISVGDNAFKGATALVEVTFERETPPTMGTGVFDGATAIETVNVPAEGENNYKDALPELPPVVIAVMYNVTFNANGGIFDGGNSTKVVQVRANGRVTAPTSPVRQGFNFGGWVVVVGGTNFDFDTSITGHRTLFAVWNAVAAKTLTAIEITQQPKTQYTVGQQFDSTGMTVIARYSDNSIAPISNSSIKILLRNASGPASGTGGINEFVETNRALMANDTVVRLSYTEGGVTRTADIQITVTGGGNQSQGYAQIGLYNLLTNRMYMGYNFSVPANNINWNTLVTGTYLNGDFKSLDALVDQIITSMLAIGTPANGTNNPKLVQIGADNQEIILITPQTIILPATNVRLYYNGADVPTPGLTQLSAPATVRVELSGGMEMLRWDAVQNASGYMVTVQGTSFQQTISATQMPFSNLNLTAPGNYIILVKALGNGTTTSDSAATAYNHVIQDGGTTIGHEDFMLMFILQELNNNNPIPPTVQTWNQLLPVFGRYASFEALFNGVKEHISTLKGITVVNITQITGGAGTGSSEIPITAQTTFNSNTMIRAYFGTGGTTTLYTLTVVNGTGTTTVNAGTSVTATATIPSGKAFIGWAENGVTISTANPYTFALTRTMTLTAVFEDTGGGTGTTHENFTPGQMKNILDGMNGSPIPATIMTNWQTILNFFSTYSNLELLLNDVKTAITADTGKTIVNITLISNAPIMMGTQFNQHYLIHWVNTTPAKTLDRIQTVQTPQTTFTAGQQYNIGGGTVIAVYTDGTSAPINGLFTVFLRNEADPQGEYTVTGRPLTINDTKVVLSYTENGITKTFDINITVTAGGTTLPRLDAPTNIRVEDVDPTGTMKILRWDVVPNASGYVVFIENRGEFTVSANAHSLSNLTPGMYRITVRAIGGANYSDSELTAFMHIVN